jgi:hypothetical protein
VEEQRARALLDDLPGDGNAVAGPSGADVDSASIAGPSGAGIDSSPTTALPRNPSDVAGDGRKRKRHAEKKDKKTKKTHQKRKKDHKRPNKRRKSKVASDEDDEFQYCRAALVLQSPKVERTTRTRTTMTMRSQLIRGSPNAHRWIRGAGRPNPRQLSIRRIPSASTSRLPTRQPFPFRLSRRPQTCPYLPFLNLPPQFAPRQQVPPQFAPRQQVPPHQPPLLLFWSLLLLHCARRLHKKPHGLLGLLMPTCSYRARI